MLAVNDFQTTKFDYDKCYTLNRVYAKDGNKRPSSNLCSQLFIKRKTMDGLLEPVIRKGHLVNTLHQEGTDDCFSS